MDDFLGSFDTVEEGKTTSSNLSKVIKDRQFKLMKWMSNDVEFLKTINETELSPKIKCHEFKQLPAERALGVWWNPIEDEFYFKIEIKDHRKTKRGLLSFICSIFDPLGFLSPVLIAPKVILQSLWKKKIGWDNELPSDVAKEYSEWQSALTGLKDIKIFPWANNLMIKISLMFLFKNCLNSHKKNKFMSTHMVYEENIDEENFDQGTRKRRAFCLY